MVIGRNRNSASLTVDPGRQFALPLPLVVNGYRRAPASSGAVVAGAGPVEPHIERIRGVRGRETRRRRRVARPGAYSQRAEVGSPRNTSTANGGRRGALVNQ